MYLDPGFGSMLIQIIVAAVAVGGVAIFSLRKKISALFSKRKVRKDEPYTKNDNMTTADNIVDILDDNKKS